MKEKINLFIISIVFICMLISACTGLISGNNHDTPNPTPTSIIPEPDKEISENKYNTCSPIGSPNITPIPTQIPGSKPGPSSKVSERSQELLSKMSIDEKVGQMFIVRCPQQDAAKRLRNTTSEDIFFFQGFQG